MKQLYYTSCISGRSLSGNSGFQVRAASEGLDASQIREATMYASYALPHGHRPTDESIRKAPVRLAIFDTEELGRIICHSVYVGKDPATGRWGNFFSHVLLDPPTEFGTSEVIKTWSDDSWRRGDGDGSTTLDDMESFEGNYKVSTREQKEFLSNEKYLAILTFILNGLVEGADVRLIVAAPPEVVVHCIQLTYQALSPLACEKLTFSTYEADPLSCPAKISATSWVEPSEAAELPSSAYSGGYRAINHFTGRSSRLAANSFVDFVVKSLQTDKGSDQLLKFKRLLNRLGVDSFRLHQIIFDLAFAPKTSLLSPDDWLLLLANKEVVQWILSREKAAGRLVDQFRRICESDDSYEAVGPSFAAALGAGDSLQDIESISADSIELCNACVVAEQYRSSPSLELAASPELSLALSLLPGRAPREIVKASVVALSDDLLQDAGTKGAMLANAIKQLGRFLDGGSAALFRLVVARLMKARTSGSQSVSLFCAVALALCDPTVGGKLTKRQAKSVVAQIKSRSAFGSLKVIHKRAERWPKNCQERWNRLTWWDRWRPKIIKWTCVVLGLVVAIGIFVAIGIIVWDKFWPPAPEWLRSVLP